MLTQGVYRTKTTHAEKNDALACRHGFCRPSPSTKLEELTFARAGPQAITPPLNPTCSWPTGLRGVPGRSQGRRPQEVAKNSQKKAGPDQMNAEGTASFTVAGSNGLPVPSQIGLSHPWQ